MKRTNEVSKLAGISKRTLQYYDDEGIMAVERSAQNHRLYDQKSLKRIWEIMLYKEMGFELNEIKKLLLLPEIRQSERLRMRIREIQEEIKGLESQMEFISLILIQGMPKKPEENEGVSYSKRITELRKKVVYE